MQSEFKAAVLCNEINLGKIAQHFGINRSFKWEEFLSLSESNLKGIIREPEDKMVYIFPFGSLVFLNMQTHEIMDVISYLRNVEKSLNVSTPFEYVDDYRIVIDPAAETAINNDYMVTENSESYRRDIVATVLAKSVALEKIEADISRLLDEIEEIVNFLHQGRLTVSDGQLAKMSARILGFKLSTISYVMLLDKPDITWVNEDAAALFSELSVLFELSDRYKKARLKTETLMDITEVFSGLAHARRGNILEWAVIILIAIELIISLLDMFFKR